MIKQFTLVVLLIASGVAARSQDTLPKFTVKNIGANRIVVSWVNPLSNISQISVQRSFDSLKLFKTILSVADPKALNNGFADTKAPNDSMYYRIFYAVEGGAFYFSESKRPILDTISVVTDPKRPAIVAAPPIDSVTKKKIESFVPSFYVYTQKDGYVFINLPDADKEKYQIKFFEDDGSYLFEIKGMKETALTLDKANFLRGGWFHFELYKNDKLVEKHKFYLPKDF